MSTRRLKRQQKITAILALTVFLVAGFWYTAEPTTPAYAQPASAVSYRGLTTNKVNSGNSSTVTSLAVPKLTSPTLALNDIMIASAVINTSTAGDIVAPAGWNLLLRTPQGNTTLYTWYKIATAADVLATNFTFTFPGGTGRQVIAIIHVYSGVDLATPINASGGQGSLLNSYTITAPSITTTKPNTMLVGTFTQSSSPTSNFGPYGGAMAPTLIERGDQSTSGQGAMLSMSMASAIFTGTNCSTTAPCATGIKTATASKSSAPSIGHLIALRLTNQQPAVSITLPSALTFDCPTGLTGISDDSVTFTGSATDPDGTVASHEWIKDGAIPTGRNDTITSPGNYTTSITWPYPSTLPVPGTYSYKLMATDDETAVGYATASVTIPANQAPVFTNIITPINVTNRGISGVTTITLGQGGSVADIPATCPEPPTVSWAKVGTTPTGGTAITDSSSVQTTVTDIITTSGRTYNYRLTATDYLGLTATKDVEVIVPSNFPPEVTNCTASPSAITLPDQYRTTVSCTVVDQDSFVWDVLWTKGKFPVGHPQYVANPPGDTIVYPTGPTTDVTYDIAAGAGGTYNYLLTARDDYGAIATGTASVVVSVAGNSAPVVNAGTDQSIALPGTTPVTLTGSYTDSVPTTPPTITWSKISGPTGGTIASPNTLSTDITGLSNEGTYVFRLTVRDGWGAIGTDDVAITASVPAYSTVAPVSGVVWASSIGWISLGGANGGNVAVNTNTGALSGYAWAANIGYINFAPAGIAPDGTNCSTSPCAVMDMSALSKNKKVDGWARACSVLTTGTTNCSGSTMIPSTDYKRGGWDGWIKLYADQVGGVWEWTNPVDRSYMGQSGVPYDPFGFHGVFYDDLLGFAWGGSVVGWIDFYGASLVMPVPILQVQPPDPQTPPATIGQLAFGDVWVGSTVDRDFTVDNVGDRGSFLRGTATVDDTTYFWCEPASDCDYTSGIAVGFPRFVTIRTRAPMTPGIYQTTVTFTGVNTNPPSSMERTVFGNAIVPVFGNDLNFGNVVVGRYRDLLLTFENAGTIDLGADTLMMPLPEYTCSVNGGASFQVSCPANLAPEVENNILIRFTPGAVAAFNGEAYLFGHDTVRFMFTGNGVLGTFQFKDQ